MELGATVCLPTDPLCFLCPLGCTVDHSGRDGTARNVTPRKQRNFTNVTWPLAIIRRDKKILLRRRARWGLLAGMWELPGGEKPGHDAAWQPYDAICRRSELFQVFLAASARSAIALLTGAFARRFFSLMCRR